jgi:hypothetical protein
MPTFNSRNRSEFKVNPASNVSSPLPYQRERMEVRVCLGTARAAQTRSLAKRCRVLFEPDDSKIVTQRFHYERAIPTGFDPEFGPHDSYARHRPIQSRVSRPDNKNRVCHSPMGAGGEICSLQSSGFANAAKECAQLRLPSSVASERRSRETYFSYQRYL